MKKTKILALLTAMLLLVSVFAACSDTGSSEAISQHSIPSASVSTQEKTSLKFVADATAFGDWDKSTSNPDYAFSFVGVGAEMGKTIFCEFVETNTTGKTLNDYAEEYKVERAGVAMANNTWETLQETEIGGYSAAQMEGFISFEDISGGKEFICTWIDVDGEIFLVTYQATAKVDGTEYDMTDVDQMMGSIVFTPIA